MKLCLAPLALALGLAVAACSSSTTGQEQARAATLTSATTLFVDGDKDADVTVARGTTVVVSLKAAGGTAYAWDVSGFVGDTVERGPVDAEGATPMVPGGTVTTRFRFVASRPGTTTVTFALANNGSADPPLATRTVRITTK